MHVAREGQDKSKHNQTITFNIVANGAQCEKKEMTKCDH